jgi:hypothetical protein
MTSRGGPGPARGWSPIVVLPALLAPLAVVAALAVPGRWLLPLLATAAVYPVFALLVLRAQRTAAAAAALMWAVTLSASVIVATAHDPARVGRAVLNGPAYRDEMMAYVASGYGRESDPARFVPQHLLHISLFVVLSLATAGLAGIAMGAVLVGYMSYYVGSLAAGPAPLLAGLFGWPPWAVLRVVAFVLLGTVLSRPLLARLARREVPAAGERRVLLVAVVLLLLDLVLKAALASHWPALLRPCLVR